MGLKSGITRNEKADKLGEEGRKRLKRKHKAFIAKVEQANMERVVQRMEKYNADKKNQVHRIYYSTIQRKARFSLIKYCNQ